MKRRSDRVISELSGAFSSQGKRQHGEMEMERMRGKQRGAGEEMPGGPAISEEQGRQAVVRCLSTEQETHRAHTPGEPAPPAAPGGPLGKGRLALRAAERW